MDVSVIIVNYNTRELLADCLRTIYAQTRQVEFEIIVVDNASSDDSITYVNANFPEVLFVGSKENLGFGRANNLGARYAIGKYLFLLNSDTLLQNDAISMFFQYMEEHGEADRLGAIGGFLWDCDSQLGLSFVDFPSAKFELFRLWRKYVKRKPIPTTEPLNVDSIIGADLFIPRNVFNALNGFDPQYFMYYEETDLQFRMAQKGWKRRLIPGPNIVHLEGGSFAHKGLTYNRFVMSQRSCNYYVRKNYHGWQWFSFRAALLVVRLIPFFTAHWTLKERLHAYGMVIKG